MSETTKQKKAILVCTWDWYYYSHRRSISKMLLQAGYQVILVTKVFSLREEIEADGVQIIELPFSRPSLNPFREYQVTKQLKQIYQREKPDLVFHIAFKPVLYGSLAARKLAIPIQVNAIAGMGQLFLGQSLKIRLIRALVMFLLKWTFRNQCTRLIVQNNKDLKYLKDKLKISESRLFLIKGVGVDLNDFCPVEKPVRDKVVVTLVSRLIKEKGVLELVESARILKKRNLEFEIRLVGDSDFESPQQVTKEQIAQWEVEGLVVWQGFQENIQAVYAESDVAVLPSYSEGLPKSLMEACACGLPIVTTNNSGCLEVVEDNFNGFIVPAKDAVSLANAIEKLIRDKQLRDAFGRRSREKSEREFELKAILKQTAIACSLPVATDDLAGLRADVSWE
ncbi:MAG: glycosyltransferase family 4 protein [Planctomycetota bacterium]|nr:glycosyltransferase family 4 protein [Planctomycetota bacterium]